MTLIIKVSLFCLLASFACSSAEEEIRSKRQIAFGDDRGGSSDDFDIYDSDDSGEAQFANQRRRRPGQSSSTL